MNPDDKQQTGIVIESYNSDDLHRVVIVCLRDDIKSHFFFYVTEIPPIELGDTLLMNFYSDEYHIYRGNDRLTFKIFPLVFPGDILLELISERMNQ